MSYLIQINELQRLTIIRALEKLPALDVTDEVETTVQQFTDLFRALPKEEAECPRCIHGLCL